MQILAIKCKLSSDTQYIVESAVVSANMRHCFPSVLVVVMVALVAGLVLRLIFSTMGRHSDSAG